MKSAFCIISAGLLLAQAQFLDLKPIDIKGVEPLASIDFELFSLGKVIHHLGNQIDNTANHVGDEVGKTTSQVGNQITKTANQVGDQVGKTATDIGDKVAEDFANGAGFAQAVSDWGKVNWKNGDGLVPAIQETAVGCSTFFNDLNALTGGNLNSEDLTAASTVASMVFPPAAIVIDSGKVIMTIGDDSQDITSLVQGISDGIQSKDYIKVAIDAFQLFQIIAKIAA